MQRQALGYGALHGEHEGAWESTVRLMLEPLNPKSPLSVTHSLNIYLLSPYCVLETGDNVFVYMELTVQWGRPTGNKKIP